MVFLFGADAFSWLFFAFITVMCLVVGIFATKYAEHLEHVKRFFVFYILSYIALVGLCFAQNYVTMYLCFEVMTLLSMPLVLHEGTKAAIAAAKKYLFYSIFGATLGLLGLFFSMQYAANFFIPGGALSLTARGHEDLLRVIVFLTVIGFGAKAGLYPLHSWLPIAHPEAPGPASAVLSGVITKAGVLCIIRVIYFVFGPDLIRGTWVQYALMGLAMLTIFLGSLMAYQQDIFKKRLAYSTVSQVSYILLGIFALTEDGLTGGLLHVVYHSVIKDALFCVAAAVIFTNGLHKVSELEGLGRKMPITFGCFTVASLGLVGIPPFAGFLSKWYLGNGILQTEIPVLSWLGPAVLLASALLTAAYLLSVSIKAFFPKKEVLEKLNGNDCLYHEAPIRMLFCMIVLAALVVVLGIAAQPWADLFSEVAGGVF